MAKSVRILKVKKHKVLPVSTPSKHAHLNPSHELQLGRLNRVVGQLQGIKRMIEEGRYCPDILTQTRAASSALKSIEIAILETHLCHCVTDALSSRDANNSQKKINELIELIKRF